MTDVGRSLPSASAMAEAASRSEPFRAALEGSSARARGPARVAASPGRGVEASGKGNLGGGGGAAYWRGPGGQDHAADADPEAPSNPEVDVLAQPGTRLAVTLGEMSLDACETPGEDTLPGVHLRAYDEFSEDGDELPSP